MCFSIVHTPHTEHAQHPKGTPDWSISKQTFAPNLSPRGTMCILHTDGNHFDLLRPSAWKDPVAYPMVSTAALSAVYTKLTCNEPLPNKKTALRYTSPATTCDCKATDGPRCHGPQCTNFSAPLLEQKEDKQIHHMICPATCANCCNQKHAHTFSTEAKTTVRMTQCGHGLFAKHVISPGTFIVQYCGQILTEAEFKKLERHHIRSPGWEPIH